MIHEALLYTFDNPVRLSVTDDGRLVTSQFAQNRNWQMGKVIASGCQPAFDAAVFEKKIYLLAKDQKNQTLLLHSDGPNYKKYVLSESSAAPGAIVDNLGLRGFFFLSDQNKNILAFLSLTEPASQKQWIAYAHPDCRILCTIPYETGAALCYVNPDGRLTLQFVDFESQYSSAPFPVFDGSGIDRVEGFAMGRWVYLIFCAKGRIFALRFDSALRRMTNLFDLDSAPSSFSISTQKEPALYISGASVSKFTFPSGRPVQEVLPYAKCRLLSRKVITNDGWYYNTPLLQENMKEAVIL